MKCTGYNTGENMIFQTFPVQNQVGGCDCLGMNPSKFFYGQEKMRRNYLTECLENKTK